MSSTDSQHWYNKRCSQLVFTTSLPIDTAYKNKYLEVTLYILYLMKNILNTKYWIRNRMCIPAKLKLEGSVYICRQKETLRRKKGPKTLIFRSKWKIGQNCAHYRRKIGNPISQQHPGRDRKIQKEKKLKEKLWEKNAEKRYIYKDNNRDFMLLCCSIVM